VVNAKTANTPNQLSRLLKAARLPKLGQSRATHGVGFRDGGSNRGTLCAKYFFRGSSRTTNRCMPKHGKNTLPNRLRQHAVTWARPGSHRAIAHRPVRTSCKARGQRGTCGLRATDSPQARRSSFQLRRDGNIIGRGSFIGSRTPHRFPKRVPAGSVAQFGSRSPWAPERKKIFSAEKIWTRMFFSSSETDPFLLPPLSRTTRRSWRSVRRVPLQDIYPDVRTKR